MDRRQFIGSAVALPFLASGLSAGTEVETQAISKVADVSLSYVTSRQQRYRDARRAIIDNPQRAAFAVDYVNALAPTAYWKFKEMHGSAFKHLSSEQIHQFLFDLFLYGDLFLKIWSMPYCQADRMYRIETTKKELVEFQYSKDGPDYFVLANPEAKTDTIRYAPWQIVHIRIGMDEQTYPYGRPFVGPLYSPENINRLDDFVKWSLGLDL